jgi:dihydroflavonol-4-reductase
MNLNKAILVTGGTGLLGSYLLRYLVHLGYQNIRAIRRPSSDLSLCADIQDSIQWVVADLFDAFALEDAMQGVVQVYHCAAMVSYDARDYKQMMKINVEGTENVVNVAMQQGVEKLLFVSSIAAIGREKNQPLIHEKAKWQRTPELTTYAISKYLSEQIVWRAYAEGLNVVIVNPSIILGSGNWNQSSTALFKQIWNGLKFYPTGTTGFVDVRDVAQFMQLLMESERSGERFIVSAQNLSFQEIFQLMAQALDKPIPTIKVSPLLREVAWRIEWLRSRITGKKLAITKETARLSSKQQFFDNSKSKQAFNFQYRRVEDSIKAIATCMKRSAADNWKTYFLKF